MKFTSRDAKVAVSLLHMAYINGEVSIVDAKAELIAIAKTAHFDVREAEIKPFYAKLVADEKELAMQAHISNCLEQKEVEKAMAKKNEVLAKCKEIAVNDRDLASSIWKEFLATGSTVELEAALANMASEVEVKAQEVAAKVEELLNYVQVNSLTADSRDVKVIRLKVYNSQLGKLIARHKHLVSLIG